MQIYKIIFFLLFSVLISCNQKTKEIQLENQVFDTENKILLSNEQYANAKIEIGKVVYKNISEVIEVNGLIDVPPQNLVSISVPMGGFLKSTDMLQGMKVKKGQHIATIENIDFISLQQDFLDTKSKLDFLNLERSRQEDLSKQNINSPKDLQQAISDYKSMLAKFNGLKEKIKLIGLDPNAVSENNISKTVAVFSPINGFVTNIYSNVGKYVNPIDVLFDIVNTEHIHAELTVFEKDIIKIKKGQKVIFTLANEENKQRTAKIFLIGREINTDRTIRIHAHLDYEDAELLPKMFIKATIEIGVKKRMAVPNDAVFTDNNQDYLFVLDTSSNDSTRIFSKLEIKKGIIENGFTAIQFIENTNVSNLQIVQKGAYNLIAKIKNVSDE